MLRQPLLGFSDFFDEVGAVKPPGKPVRSAPGKPVQGKPPTGKPTGTAPPPGAPGRIAPGAKPGKYFRKYPSASRSKTVQQHGKVLGKAKATLLKAARGLGRAQMLLAKKPPAAVRAAASAAMKTAATKATVARQAAVQAKRTPTPAAQRAAAVTRGVASKSILGAAAKMVKAKKLVPIVVTAKMSPKAKAAVAKHNAALAAAKKAAQALAQNTLKAKKSVQKLAKAAVSQKKVAKALRTKRTGRVAVGELMGHHLIGQEVAEALGEYYEMVGAAPDPMNPGFLDDDSPDPAFQDTGMDYESEPLVSESDISGLTEDESDLFDIIQAAKDFTPVKPDEATVADYRDVGGILYDESKGRPNGFLGSYGLMTRATDIDNSHGEIAGGGGSDGTDHFGYVWGHFEMDGPEKGIRWGAKLDENAWNHIYGAHTTAGQDKGNWFDTVTPEEAFKSDSKRAPHGVPYGPLVGNPAYPEFKGLRADAKGNLFWYPQEAPEWIVAPLRQAAELTAAAEKKAAEDEKKQYELEQEKLRRDEAAAQAAQDAANALAESAAASEAKIAATQEETKQLQETTAQAQQETQYQQTLIEQAREEAASEQQAAQQIIEQAKADAAAEAQAQQLLLQRAQRQEQLLAETPELEAALMVRDAGLLEEGAEEEGGEEYAEEAAAEEEPSYEDTTAYSEPEAESDAFRHPIQDDDYEASGFEDDGGFDDSGEDLVF